MPTQIHLILFSAAVLTLGTTTRPRQPDPPPCPSVGGGAATMLRDYQFADTTTDVSMKIWRQSIGLPAIPVSQIVLVSDTTVCRRAVNAYNAIVTVGSLPATNTVNVVKYGTTRYIIGDPAHTVGEWVHEPVVDSSFLKIAVAGR